MGPSHTPKVAPGGPKGLIKKLLIMEGLRIAPPKNSKVTLCGFKQLWTYCRPPYCLAPLCNDESTVHSRVHNRNLVQLVLHRLIIRQRDFLCLII